MGLLDFHPPTKGNKLAHDIEIPTRRVGDQGHNRRLSDDIVEVKADLVRIPHS
jgi:hypothetical protein